MSAIGPTLMANGSHVAGCGEADGKIVEQRVRVAEAGRWASTYGTRLLPNLSEAAVCGDRKSQVSKPTSEQIYSQLTETLRDVFDDDDLVARADLDAPQVDGWDSMGNVRLFLAIEQTWNVRFGAGEISDIKNVGELVAVILRKL